MPRYILGQVAGVLDIGVSGCTIFEVAWELTSHIMQEDDETIMRYLSHRVAKWKAKGADEEDILEVDEAAACLDENDQRELRKHQKVITAAAEVEEAFVAEYKARRSKTHGGGDGKKGKRSVALSKYKGPKSLPPLSTISQATAKLCMPPGGALWKANASGSWNSKVMPFIQCSRSWKKYGEEESLRLCIKDAWTNFLLGEGLPEDQCPIGGLFVASSPNSGGSS